MTTSLRAILTLIAINCAVAVSAFSIRGKVVDSQNTPEAYATVRIFNLADTLHAAALGVTDDDGAFSLPVKSAGEYNVIISSVGKKTLDNRVKLTATAADADLGTMVMADNAAELGEVEVVASKPLVVKEIDRIGYDVQADEDAKTSTVQDVLRKVPMVTVEADGTIKVKGSTNFKIYKDGRPNNALTNISKDIFAAITS
ncbi:MAG: carboxypeptidase-like regulatory domain-containing protein [Muribaculaceae bacterium]|nr:carboxypeptidase-like regulatory domain-containing protein [Muribaculaceae bacterium]